MKFLATLILSSALLAPAAMASERGDCMKAVRDTFKADMAVCKEKTDKKERKDCSREAHQKAKAAHRDCKSKSK